jgi:hypothetical protein
MVGRSHYAATAKGAHRSHYPSVIGGHQYGVRLWYLHGPLIHVLDHGLAVNVGERFARQSRGLITGWDNNNKFFSRIFQVSLIDGIRIESLMSFPCPEVDPPFP